MPASDSGFEFYDTREAAKMLTLKPETLEKWRIVGGGPEFCKFGRAIRYSLKSLQQYAARAARSSTSEQAK